MTEQLSFEALWAEFLFHCRIASGGRLTVTPCSYAPRCIIGPAGRYSKKSYPCNKYGSVNGNLLVQIPEPEDMDFLNEEVLRFEGNFYDTIKQRNDHVKLILRSQGDLPSSPARPPNYNISFKSEAGRSIFGFCSLRAGASMLRLVKGSGYTWLDDNTVRTHDTHITIYSEFLEDIVECPDESYNLPAPYPMFAKQILGQMHHVPETPAEESKKSKRPTARKSKAKASATGLRSIAEIAESAGITPSKARQLLRKNKVEKPEAGWAWSTIDAEKIEALLTPYLDNHATLAT